VTEALLGSLARGTLLWMMGESGLEEGSGDSGGPMVMDISGRRLVLRDLEGDILGGGSLRDEVEVGDGVGPS
jgi:hypothetical protein